MTKTTFHSRFYIFQCGCKLEKGIKKKYNNPRTVRIVCPIHEKPIKNFLITCRGCGKEILCGPINGRREYCRECRQDRASLSLRRCLAKKGTPIKKPYIMCADRPEIQEPEPKYIKIPIQLTRHVTNIEEGFLRVRIANSVAYFMRKMVNKRLGADIFETNCEGTVFDQKWRRSYFTFDSAHLEYIEPEI